MARNYLSESYDPFFPLTDERKEKRFADAVQRVSLIAVDLSLFVARAIMIVGAREMGKVTGEFQNFLTISLNLAHEPLAREITR